MARDLMLHEQEFFAGRRIAWKVVKVVLLLSLGSVTGFAWWAYFGKV